MQFFCYILFFLIGLALIIIGGNVLVKNALKISKITGIPEILIGATIVSLATTLPELSVTVFSNVGNLSDLAIGNAVGSVLFNLLFIIGIVLTFSPQKIDTKNLNTNFYLLFFTTLFLFVLAIFNFLNIATGCILLCIFIIFFIVNILDANKRIIKEGIQIQTAPVKNYKKKLAIVIVYFIIGSIFVTFGAKSLVTYGENIARFLGVSEHIIGVSIIAVGTSLPELVTAVNSIKMRSTNMAVGNTFGANILSSTLLIGTTSIMRGGDLKFDNNITYVALPIILISMLIIYIPIAKKGKSFKLQGILLLTMSLIYYLTLFF